MDVGKFVLNSKYISKKSTIYSLLNQPKILIMQYGLILKFSVKQQGD